MARFLVWLSGSISLVWLAYHFGVWHVLFSLAIVVFAFVWIIFGGYLMARKWGKRPRVGAPSSQEEIAIRIAAARQEWVNVYGEDNALLVERVNPQVWANAVHAKWAGK